MAMFAAVNSEGKMYKPLRNRPEGRSSLRRFGTTESSGSITVLLAEPVPPTPPSAAVQRSNEPKCSTRLLRDPQLSRLQSRKYPTKHSRAIQTLSGRRARLAPPDRRLSY